MSDEIKKIEAIASAFEEMKSKNDAHLAEIKKGFDDVVRREEVDRISAAIGNMEEDVKAAKIAALSAGGVGKGGTEKDEYKQAFFNWFRKGDRAEAELEAKAAQLSTTTGAEGGFAVPEELDRTILDLIKQVSPVRAVANVITVGTSDYKKLVNVRGTASGWVGETATRPSTTAPELAEVAIVPGEVYANIAATQRMLDDVFFDAESWISSEVLLEFARAEGAAFISGDGTNKPTGFLSGTINTSGDATRTFGHLQRILTGAAGAFATPSTTASPADAFIDAVYALKSEMRAGAGWMMNATTQAAVRKFKTTDGDYIWQPGLVAGQPATILGYPVFEAQDMPSVGTNTDPVAFGNWQRGYTIVDRMGTTTLRDPYTNKPYVQFYFTKRVGGKVIDSQAIKVIATRTAN